ncbi:RsmB/NOP family class I SAM-dependent RNA methyltransferase [Lactobacillus corticis]|uniref:23S rRNA methyltransferase n=1 Tax=Lactobacillus corticis TaxID=2201249 RepID=A0A916QIL4_9LACO|nr:RsmB/NOP family class I SAM-dependent RNA methyltransferase [Lactobacillus corticis]GFZ27038.1 23S rRNA methyltransferase [Lactobacillus corticis]
MLGLSAEFKTKFVDLLGPAEAENLFKAMEADSKKAFRVNSLKASQNVAYSTSQPVPYIPSAYYGNINGQDPEWVSGTVYSQDPAAMFPAFVTKVHPGEKVLDLCAAPGGKSTALGQALDGQGLLVANEINGGRAAILRENLERWGLANALILNEDSQRLAQHFPSFFDRILVDAPCSGEGMFRKDPDAIAYWSQAYVLKCAQRQKEILAEAVKMLTPGGILVYSTCTFSPEEDEEIVAWLVENYGFEILPADLPDTEKISLGRPEWGGGLADLAKTLRFWPQDGLGEGQFVAILKKPGEKAAVKAKKPKKREKGRLCQRPTPTERSLIKEIISQFNLPQNLQDWEKRVCVSNGHVFIPAYTGDLTGLKVISNGLELGLLKKKRFEPGHHLAEVLGTIAQTRVIDLDQPAYQKYLHGETVKVVSNLKGFVLVSSRGLIFSFGKLTGQQVLKNFYPKGLRQFVKGVTND